MSAHKKKRVSKARTGFIRTDWHQRVDLAFLAFWAARKKNETLPRIKDKEEADRQFAEWRRDAAQASRALNQARVVIKNSVADKIQSAILKPLDVELVLSGQVQPPPAAANGIAGYAQNPEASLIFRWMVFLKYGITFRELIQQVDIQKNPTAHRRLRAVHRDYWRLLSESDFKDLKLKFNLDHFAIITQGFDFGRDTLTPDELAECLDEICPCECRHSPEYIKKLRTRVRQACKRVTLQA